MTTPRPSAARAAADALVAAGIIPQAKSEVAAAVIAANLPRGGQYSFASDAEFLHSCLEHHVGAYFKQVLELKALTHHTSTGGRLLRDTEIQEAAVEITSQVMGELGGDYLRHMDRYFGDEEGATAYVFSRVHSALLEAATKFNDEYLAALQRKQATRRLSSQVNG